MKYKGQEYYILSQESWEIFITMLYTELMQNRTLEWKKNNCKSMVLINSFLYPFVQHLKYEEGITIYRYIDYYMWIHICICGWLHLCFTFCYFIYDVSFIFRWLNL